MQSSKGDTDVKNRLLELVEEGKGGKIALKHIHEKKKVRETYT